MIIKSTITIINKLISLSIMFVRKSDEMKRLPARHRFSTAPQAAADAVILGTNTRKFKSVAFSNSC